jgi:ketosteroid isomerase-like protein
MSNNSNKKQIRKIIESWATAIRAGDMEGILANHTNDILMFDVPEPLQSRGKTAYKKTWELFFQYGAPSKDVFVIEQLRIIAGEDVAFATGLLRIGGSKKPICRLTLGLKKMRGRWLIAHEHHSAPHKLNG